MFTEENDIKYKKPLDIECNDIIRWRKATRNSRYLSANVLVMIKVENHRSLQQRSLYKSNYNKNTVKLVGIYRCARHEQ